MTPGSMSPELALTCSVTVLWPAQNWVTWAFATRSWLTEGCFRSWELDVQKTSSLQLIYCLPWRGRNSERSVWGSPWTQVPWPLRTYQCELFRKQRQKTSLASFLLYLMFHYLLPKTRSNHELCHPATSHNIHRPEKIRERRKTDVNKHHPGCQAGEWESWGFPPARSLIGDCVFLWEWLFW